jgi:uncharacterized PurR-regulated membrane protein YhhQ (DUF165 family)
MYTIVILISAYIAAQIFSDIGSLRIVMFLGLSMDAGTYIYPIIFTLRDLIQKQIGKKATRLLIITAGLINLFDGMPEHAFTVEVIKHILDSASVVW